MGFDMAFANASSETSPSDANFRLNIWGMAGVRQLLNAAGALDWGTLGPLQDVDLYAPDDPAGSQAYEAFQQRLARWAQNGEPMELARPARPGCVVAAKLLVNDGQRVTPDECLAIVRALGASPYELARAFAQWCRVAATHGGFVVW